MGGRFVVRDGETRVTCEELIEFLHAYLDGELAEDRRRLFERHLERCPSCVAYLDSYRRTIALARDSAAPGDPEPPELPEELVQAILAARPT
jgi:anti-sigma factor (TIGR02949 family)